VLSGFLITGILLNAKGRAAYLRTFYARRALRIFPLYYLVLVLCLVVAPRVMRMESPEYRELFAKQGWLWFYVGNIKTAMGTEVCPFTAGWLQFDHFWSLAIEEQFYLVWPVLVLLLSRRGMMGVCWALMAGALGLRWWLYWRGDPTMAFYTFTLCRIDALATGGLLALAARRAETAARIVRVAPAVFVVTGTVLVSIWGGNFCGYVIGGTLLAVFFAALVVLVVAGGVGGVGRRGLDWPVMRVFGRYSYAMYVLHPFLMAGVMSRVSYTWLGRVTHSGPVGVVLYLGIGFGLTLGAGWVSWNVWERHFLRLKGWFEYGAGRGR
jgi:peptidoglycan/LPS O-acetylase OafA/YrhL